MMFEEATAHFPITEHQYNWRVAAKTHLALQALETAEAASGDEWITAARELLDKPLPRHAAAALMGAMAATQRSQGSVQRTLKQATRAIRDAVVYRCCSWSHLSDRTAFLEAAEEAFDGPLDRDLRATLLLGYHSLVRATLGAAPPVGPTGLADPGSASASGEGT